MIETKIYVCNRCSDTDSPCIYTVVKGAKEDPDPGFCPQGGFAKWKKLQEMEVEGDVSHRRF